MKKILLATLLTRSSRKRFLFKLLLSIGLTSLLVFFPLGPFSAATFSVARLCCKAVESGVRLTTVFFRKRHEMDRLISTLFET